MRRAAILAIGLVACSSKGKAAPTSEPRSSSVPAPTVQRVTAGTGIFDGDELIACIDSTLDVPTDEAARAFRERMAKDVPKDQFFPNGCAKTVARAPLATCVHTVSATTITNAFYDVSVLDHEMRSCMGESGTWKAVARDSREYREAEASAKLRDLKRRRDELR